MSSIDFKDASQFYISVVNSAIINFKKNDFRDNWDARRFGRNDPGFHKNIALEINKFSRVASEMFESFCLFSDNYSRILYFTYLLYRIAGHTAVKISADYKISRDKSINEYKRIVVAESKESLLKMKGIAGEDIRHFDFTWNNCKYTVDCFTLQHILAFGQYYYERNGISIKPEEGDFVIDAGACLGDTACVFSESVKKLGKVYSFDPIPSHCNVLRHNFEQFNHSNCFLYPLGLSNIINFDINTTFTELNPELFAPGFSFNNNSDLKLPLTTLDCLFEKGQISKVDFLKMDIEGSELNALKGAKEVIRKFKPKLAISLYHKERDLFEIPLYLHKEFGFYKFYLDHYSIHQEELVLYGLPI